MPGFHSWRLLIKENGKSIQIQIFDKSIYKYIVARLRMRCTYAARMIAGRLCFAARSVVFIRIMYRNELVSIRIMYRNELVSLISQGKKFKFC